MKIFSKIPGFNSFPMKIRNNPKLFIFIMSGIFIILGFLMFLGSKDTQKIKYDLKPSAVIKPVEEKEGKDVGVLVGAVDTKSYVARIEKQYYDIASKTDSMQEEMSALEKSVLELRESQSDLSKIVMNLDKRITEQVVQVLARQQGLRPPDHEASKPVINLEIAKIAQIKDQEALDSRKYVYLPLGSFVKCTLLTGVYAPVDESNPLPVLISVDEAFYGPNNTRIPLKGALAIGKAIGNISSRRAIVQIVSFSTVLPNGRVFEQESNLGYLADESGQLGIPGELIYNTGKQLGLDFLSGFLAGGAGALSEAETSTVVGPYGQTNRNVTGDTARYGMFSGLANSAQGLSEYYQKQLELIIPAVKIEAGSHATFVIQKGVEIEGLEVSRDSFGYIN